MYGPVVMFYFNEFIFLLLHTDKSFPVVNHPVLQKTISIEQNASLTCSVTGGCNVNYQWIRESGSFPTKVTGINSSTLVIPDVRSSDDDTYTCVASTESESVTAVIRLTATGMTIILLL